MLTFDVAMPLMLFTVTLAALLSSKRVEPKLKTTFEEREFKARDAVLFVVLIAVAVSVVVFVPGMALVAGFLFSYCSLLFTYLSFFPPLLFFVVFFLFMYEPVPLLSLVLLDVAGALFSVLITLYLASLFTWKVAFF